MEQVYKDIQKIINDVSKTVNYKLKSTVDNEKYNKLGKKYKKNINTKTHEHREELSTISNKINRIDRMIEMVRSKNHKNKLIINLLFWVIFILCIIFLFQAYYYFYRIGMKKL